MTIYDRLLASRTVRRFGRDGAPTGEELKSFVAAARVTPSAANLQRLRFCILEGEAADKAFSGISMGGYLPERERTAYGERPSAYIVLLSESDEDTNLAIDIGICAEAITLAASEKGYGSCMIRNFKRDIILSLVKTKGLFAHLVIALGVPAERAEIADLGADGSIKYYHDERGVNIVPKRPLSELSVE